MIDIWTPKEQRSREKWREKGRLVEIQVTNSLSRKELSEYFRQQAEAKLEPIVPTETIIYNSADIVLGYLTPDRNKKKKM